MSINPDLFLHDSDKAALKALKAIPGFSQLLKGFMSVGYEKIILLYNPSIYETADTISTYVYRRGLVDGKYSFASAVGLMNSVINFMLLITSDRISKRMGQSGLF